MKAMGVILGIVVVGFSGDGGMTDMSFVVYLI